MRRFTAICLCVILLSGCATYKFQYGKPPYDAGYVVSRDNRVIVEYTAGRDNTVPKLALAKERFKRRRNTVEDYYKKMGYIESRLKETLWNPAVSVVKMVGGVFRLPFVALSDYKYKHNLQYRQRVRKMQEEQDLREELRMKKLKEQLAAYIEKDLTKEASAASRAAVRKAGVPEEPVTKIDSGVQKFAEVSSRDLLAAGEKEVSVQAEPSQEPAFEKQNQAVQEISLVKPLEAETQGSGGSLQEEIVNLEENVLEKKTSDMSAEREQSPATEPQFQQGMASGIPEHPEQEKIEAGMIPAQKAKKGPVGKIKAIIIAKPTKGYSPLKVQFYGNRSHSSHAKIISYSWDFGDGDTSTKTNPSNTYWSTTYGSRFFNVRLTVIDAKGNSSEASAVIEAIGK